LCSTSYHEPVTDDAIRVPCPLRETASDSPGAPAILGASGALTYGELDRRVTAVEGRLRGLGLGAGARVALYLPSDERYIILLLGLIRAGCIACPLSTRLPPQAIMAPLERAACRGLVVPGSEPSAQIDPGIAIVRPAELLAGEGDLPRKPSEKLRLALDTPATIIFTSGSTSAPKAALHTFGNHYYNALGSNANIQLAPGDRWLLSLPLYHVGGLSILFRCLLAGSTVALPAPGAPLGRALSERGATHVSLVATQLVRLLREEFDPGGLKVVLLGGGPVPANLVDEAAARGFPVRTSYGLTEMASQVTATPPDASREELHTSGRVLPYREISISGEGEILVRGETLFAGYVEGAEVDLPLDADGWFHTRDLGELDSEERLRVRGRRDNLFISGGENVQPEEIEEALCRLREVEEAVVVPVPDHEFGARPVAFVRTAGGVVRSADLARALEPVLPRFKIPISFRPWPEELERGMKMERAFFRELAREE
jgi:o-succinylbenzoate---CoA ligase